jgi:hypothetical protein
LATNPSGNGIYNLYIIWKMLSVLQFPAR